MGRDAYQTLWLPYDFNEGKSRILRVPDIRDLETLVRLSNDFFPFLDVTNLQLRFPGENGENVLVSLGMRTLELKRINMPKSMFLEHSRSALSK